MFLTDDFVIRSYGDEKFILVQSLMYKGKDQTFEVPPGHYTDFASVPKVFTWLIPRYGAYTRAAILHDYFCDTDIVSRRDADGLFRRILRELGVSFVRRWMMWGAVRAASGMSNANGKEWLQFILVALFSIPFILIPTVVVGLWTLMFKIIDIPARSLTHQ